MKENIKGPNKMERHKKRKNMQFLQVLAKAQASIHMIFLQRKIQGWIYVQVFRGWSEAISPLQ